MESPDLWRCLPLGGGGGETCRQATRERFDEPEGFRPPYSSIRGCIDFTRLPCKITLAFKTVVVATWVHFISCHVLCAKLESL